MSSAPRFTFFRFFFRFTVRLTCWLAICTAAPYALKCYEERTRGGIFEAEPADSRPAPVLAADRSDDASGPSGAIVGFAAQPQPSQHRYIVRPIVPFRTAFRGFIYDSLDQSPMTQEVAVTRVRAPSIDEPLVAGRLSGYHPPSGVDLTTEPFRLGNVTPAPHPAGGWFLLCGAVCLILLPGRLRGSQRGLS